MPWSIFNETLRQGWQGMIYWGLGIGVFGYMMTLIIPNIDVLKQFESLMSTMPAIVKALGMEDAAQMATPEGFMSAAIFGRAPLLLAVYAVLAGLNVSANEEDAGIMDILLSLPLPRWRIILEKFMAYTLMLVTIVIIGFMGIYLGNTTSSIHVETGKLIASEINMLPILLVMLSFTMFTGAFFRHKTQATAVSTFFIIGSYVLDFAGSAASESPIARLHSISIFAYYDNGHVMQNGLNAAYVLLLLGLTALLVIASVWCFQRRDVGI